MLENVLAWSRMPEVSRFFGILIRMYFDEHDPPHFHAISRGMRPRLGSIR